MCRAAKQKKKPGAGNQLNACCRKKKPAYHVCFATHTERRVPREEVTFYLPHQAGLRAKYQLKARMKIFDST